MTVQELIDALQKMPLDATVVTHYHDDGFEGTTEIEEVWESDSFKGRVVLG